MPTIVNISHEPLRLPLPGGKMLHLGVGQRGQISTQALESRAITRRVEEGLVRIEDESAAHNSSNGTAPHANPRGAGATGHSHSVSHSSGDR